MVVSLISTSEDSLFTEFKILVIKVGGNGFLVKEDINETLIFKMAKS